MTRKIGRGKSHGRSEPKQTSSMPQQQQQQLPHAQPPSSSGAIRRPGPPIAQTSLGTGAARGISARRTDERGDGAVTHMSRGIAKLNIQHRGDGSGDTGASASTLSTSSRGVARGKRFLPSDIFVTRPSHIRNKMGVSGNRIMLKSNYFKLLKATDWCIQQYRVDFAPEEDRTGVRKGLLKLHKNKIGQYIFDGTVLYASAQFQSKEMEFTSIRQSDEQPIRITIRLVTDLTVGDYHYLQFFNIIMRKCFEHLKLKLVGRNYFDPNDKVLLPEYKLELWPGYITSIRQHEHDILMCAEITHKIMRLETLLDILYKCRRENPGRSNESFADDVIGTVVLTNYNNNTYRIEDVDFSTTPIDTFRTKDGGITYVDYYKKKYDVKIYDLKQPMLVSRTKAKDRQAEQGELIYLVPELCRATGLTDSMRDNYRLMSSLATFTRVNPETRIERLLNFNKRLHNVPDIMSEFDDWNLKLDKILLDTPARVLLPERLLFGGDATAVPERGDWSTAMQKMRCLVSKRLCNWTVIIMQRDKSVLQKFLDILIKVAAGISFQIEQPKIHEITDDRPGTYSQTLEDMLSKKILELVFCVVSNNRSDRYSSIKKKCCVDRPVPSQVCMFRTLTHRNVRSIATKIAIQMNCKLGGAPWCVHIPLDNLMIVGFDVCHDTLDKTKDYGAMVASLNKNMTKYYSAVNAHVDGDELSNDLAVNICKAAEAFRAVNRVLPMYIMIYRDGVGEGQVPQVKERELEKIKKALNRLYGGSDKYKLGFIIVTKRLNTRLFLNNNNPPPGTVVDDVITNPVKYDFFIVSQNVRQGTITPTSYNIIDDNLGLDPDKIQRLTYKLTHMYFNCSNTVRVPAPCHYAHKLAFLVSRFLHRAPDSKLENTLYFL